MNRLTKLGALSLLLAFASFGQAAFAADACDPVSISMATEPAQPQLMTGLQRAQEMLQSIPAETDVVLVGDSLMREWDNSLGRDFPGVKVWNFAAGGNRTQNVVWTLDKLGKNALSPRAVVVGIGTNNLTDQVAPCAILKGEQLIVAKAQALWPRAHVFVFGIPPRGADFQEADAQRREYNALLAESVKNNPQVTAFFVDDAGFTCGEYGKPALPKNTLQCFPEQAYSCGNYKGDRIHISADGYVLLRKALSGANMLGPHISALN